MFDFLFSSSAWLGALMIFGLRITDMSLDTLRMLFVVRGRKGIAWVLGFFQSAVFVLAITKVLSDLSNPLTVLGYAAGFATGNVLGMLVEERLAIGHIQLQIVTRKHGAALAKALREGGYGVTEISARGKALRFAVETVRKMGRSADGLTWATPTSAHSATHPEASPSMPSVRFTAFEAPVMTSTVRTMKVYAPSMSPCL